MQDYPPRPTDKTVHVQLENHSALSAGIVSSGMLDLIAYYAGYPSLSGFTYLGQTDAEFT